MRPKTPHTVEHELLADAINEHREGIRRREETVEHLTARLAGETSVRVAAELLGATPSWVHQQVQARRAREDAWLDEDDNDRAA